MAEKKREMHEEDRLPAKKSGEDAKGTSSSLRKVNEEEKKRQVNFICLTSQVFLLFWGLNLLKETTSRIRQHFTPHVCRLLILRPFVHLDTNASDVFAKWGKQEKEEGTWDERALFFHIHILQVCLKWMRAEWCFLHPWGVWRNKTSWTRESVEAEHHSCQESS